MCHQDPGQPAQQPWEVASRQAASLDFGVFSLGCRVWGLDTATAPSQLRSGLLGTSQAFQGCRSWSRQRGQSQGLEQGQVAL